VQPRSIKIGGQHEAATEGAVSRSTFAGSFARTVRTAVAESRSRDRPEKLLPIDKAARVDPWRGGPWVLGVNGAWAGRLIQEE